MKNKIMAKRFLFFVFLFFSIIIVTIILKERKDYVIMKSDFLSAHKELLIDVARYHYSTRWLYPSSTDDVLSVMDNFFFTYGFEIDSVDKHFDFIEKNKDRYDFVSNDKTAKSYIFFGSRIGNAPLPIETDLIGAEGVSFISFLFNKPNYLFGIEIDYSDIHICNSPQMENQPFSYIPEYWYDVLKKEIPKKIKEVVELESFMPEQSYFLYFLRFNRATKFWTAKELCCKSEDLLPLSDRLKQILEYEFHRHKVEVFTDSVIYPLIFFNNRLLK